ncbi:MAG: NAD-binding protein [Proteobacteria bacterium]|nr:NAD-binding protein [Pseudomonadota bacterium]
MNSMFFLILRQMRLPLLVLSAVYAVATLGLTLIPGRDPDGNLWYMDFFHAFYFISFMGTTTGFGEIPYPFSGGQRLWALVFIYITVATWIYTIGSLISLLQSESLRNALTHYRFERQVRNLSEPFYLICGYGDTGSKLVAALGTRLMPATVLELRQERLDDLYLSGNPIFMPALRCDASKPDNLVLAGLTHPLCQAVVAITNDNAANLHIAITAKVMNPDLKVICRADSHEVEANMASFGTDYIVDPYDTFAHNLGQVIYAPSQYLLARAFRGQNGDPIPTHLSFPDGRWIICGFGRFGSSLNKEMVDHGLPVQVIEANPTLPDLPADAVIGLGTEAVTLNEADVMNSVGIIAGTHDDSNNLSIMVTALQLNPELFTVVRQNVQANKLLFEHSKANIVMEPSRVVAEHIRTILVNRTIDDFLSLARAHDDTWARVLLKELRELATPGCMPATWEVNINLEEAHAVVRAIEQGRTVRISDLLMDHTDREQGLRCMPLFHTDPRGAFCLPPRETTLEIGDRLLFAGDEWAAFKMKWTLLNSTALWYVMTGEVEPQTSVGRWLNNLRAS